MQVRIKNLTDFVISFNKIGGNVNSQEEKVLDVKKLEEINEIKSLNNFIKVIDVIEEEKEWGQQ